MMNIDLNKIVDEVWNANNLHSNTYKKAALTCMKLLLKEINKQANTIHSSPSDKKIKNL